LKTTASEAVQLEQIITALFEHIYAPRTVWCVLWKPSYRCVSN
jgi:hypothetical protein